MKPYPQATWENTEIGLMSNFLGISHGTSYRLIVPRLYLAYSKVYVHVYMHSYSPVNKVSHLVRNNIIVLRGLQDLLKLEGMMYASSSPSEPPPPPVPTCIPMQSGYEHLDLLNRQCSTGGGAGGGLVQLALHSSTHAAHVLVCLVLLAVEHCLDIRYHILC